MCVNEWDENRKCRFWDERPQRHLNSYIKSWLVFLWNVLAQRLLPLSVNGMVLVGTQAAWHCSWKTGLSKHLLLSGAQKHSDNWETGLALNCHSKPQYIPSKKRKKKKSFSIRFSDISHDYYDIYTKKEFILAVCKRLAMNVYFLNITEWNARSS